MGGMKRTPEFACRQLSQNRAARSSTSAPLTMAGGCRRVNPEEYLAFGVAEYWIIDGQTRRMTVNTRWRGLWKPRVLKPNQKYVTPLLPGFALDLKRVFAAGR